MQRSRDLTRPTPSPALGQLNFSLKSRLRRLVIVQPSEGPEVVGRMIPSFPAAVCEMNMEPERAGLVFGGWDVCENAGEYRPRRPAESVLYGVVAGHVETFLARQRERDRLVPRFVEREFRSFLDCGILARGFLGSIAMTAPTGQTRAV